MINVVSFLGGIILLGVMPLAAWVGLAFAISKIGSIENDLLSFVVESAIPLIVSAIVGFLALRIPLKYRKSRMAGEPLQVKRDSDGRRVLTRNLIVSVEGTCIMQATGKSQITIDKGFKTDYSSIPTMFQWVVHWSKVDLAGVVHDWLYRDGRKKLGGYTRRQADEMWKVLALSGKHRASWAQSVVGWLAVRSFARRFWVCPRKFETLHKD